MAEKQYSGRKPEVRGQSSEFRGQKKNTKYKIRNPPLLVTQSPSHLVLIKSKIQNPKSEILTFASAMNNISIKNKRAGFEYFLTEEFTAGIVLTGTEIKSIRDGKANLTDAYCAFEGDELFVKNMHISEYKFGTYANHEPKRDRKLLLNKRELRKIISKTREKGLTIIPTLLYINDKGLAKINIAIAKGKKLYDKRETLKSKDTKREIERHKEF